MPSSQHTATVYERGEVSPLMQKAIRTYILREKEKRKQEAAEAEKVFERRVREEEEKRKKKEEELSTIEDIKDQLSDLTKSLETLREEKHQLFYKFKRLLNNENLKKAQKQIRDCGEESAQSSNMIPPRYNPSIHAMNIQGGQPLTLDTGNNPGRPNIHYNHPHMTHSPSSQARKLSDQHSTEESMVGGMIRSYQQPPPPQPNKNPQVPSSYSLLGRHSRSPSGGRIPHTSDQFHDHGMPPYKMPRLQK